MMRPYEMLARYYSRDWAAWGMQYLKLIPWIEERFTYRISSIVDLACGTGVLVDELHKHHYTVMGIDSSPEMIEVARRICPDVEYLVEDIADASIGCFVDLAICGFDSLNYLTDPPHLQRALKNVRRMLKRDGFFTFDINTPYLCEERQHGVIEREVQGNRFQQILSYDRDQRIATTIFDFGEGRQETHVQRAYTKAEMEEHLRQAGFTMVGAYESFDMKDAQETSMKPIFVVRNQG